MGKAIKHGGSLIKSINAKITGFTTYHKCEESTEIFRYLDVIINALLLKFMTEKYPDLTLEQIKRKFWIKDSIGRGIFAVPNNQSIRIQNMEETVLVKPQKIDLSKNVFIDREYFEEIERERDISNVVGKYRKVWERQEGICYICKNKIDINQEKTIIYKGSRINKNTNNIAYVHKFCERSQIQYVKLEDKDIKDISVNELLKEITSNNQKRKKESKFIRLTEYFHNLRRNKVTLKFTDIERICGFKLCNSAYAYRTYFTNKGRWSIAESWKNQGFKLTKIDLENKKLYFEKIKFSRAKIPIPKFMYRVDLPMELVMEVKQFFLHIKEKYRIE